MGFIFVGSFFSEFLGILIRFFQIAYIIDFIYLLKIDLGKYTNTFLNFWEFEIKLYIETNSYLGINNIMEKLITKIITSNPKLKNYEFIYLTNFNLEFIFILILLLWEFIFFFINYLINKFKKNKISHIKKDINKDDSKNLNNINLNTENIKNIKIKKFNTKMVYTKKVDAKKINLNINPKKKLKLGINEIYDSIYKKAFNILVYKFESLKFSFIGFIFPNLVTSILIYSEVFYNFNIIYNIDGIKLIIILLFYYIWVVTYIWEVLKSVNYLNINKKKYKRIYFSIFNNKYDGLHNYVLIFSLIRDILIIFVGVIVNIPILIQSVLFIVIQFIFVMVIFRFKSKYDYKNIQIYKLQEIINLSLLVITFIFYFYKGVFLQFLFIILFYFLLFISILNWFYEFLILFTKVYHYLKEWLKS